MNNNNDMTIDDVTTWTKAFTKNRSYEELRSLVDSLLESDSKELSNTLHAVADNPNVKYSLFFDIIAVGLAMMVIVKHNEIIMQQKN